MKKLFLALALILVATNASAAANKYIIDPTHANLVWSAEHFGYSTFYGRFDDVQGTVFFDQTNPSMSNVSVVIKTASVDTYVPKLTEHLKGEDFFKVEQFPEARFTSTEVKVTGKKTAVIQGNLTLLGVVKPVKLKVKFNKADVHPYTKKRTVGFSAETTIKRSDFGMKYGIPGVSDDVKLIIEIEAVHEEDLLLDIK